MAKTYCHTNETEQKILQRMLRLGYSSKDTQAVLPRSKAWVSRHRKRLSKTKGSTKVKKAGRKRIITPLVFERLHRGGRQVKKPQTNASISSIGSTGFLFSHSSNLWSPGKSYEELP